MAQSERDRIYIATALAHGAPVLGAMPGPPIADVLGNLQQAILGTIAGLPAQSQQAVALHMTPQGPLWAILHGDYAGGYVPYHNAAWSVNPAGATRPVGYPQGPDYFPSQQPVHILPVPYQPGPPGPVGNPGPPSAGGRPGWVFVGGQWHQLVGVRGILPGGASGIVQYLLPGTVTEAVPGQMSGYAAVQPGYSYPIAYGAGEILPAGSVPWGSPLAPGSEVLGG